LFKNRIAARYILERGYFNATSRQTELKSLSYLPWDSRCAVDSSIKTISGRIDGCTSTYLVKMIENYRAFGYLFF